MSASRSLHPIPAAGQPKGGGPPAFELLEDLPVLDLLRACRKLGTLWALGPDAMANLLGTSRTTWFRWLESAKAGREPLWTADQRSRALALLRIFEAVGDLHAMDEEALRWPHERLNAPGFQGGTPLEVMLSGFEGLLLVRDYLNFLLDAWS